MVGASHNSVPTRSAAAPAPLALTLLALVALLVGAGEAYAQVATIDARLSARTIRTSETVTLTIEATGDIHRVGAPESDDFTVIGRQSQTSVSFINGQMSRRLRMDFVLAPRRAGTLNTGTVAVYRNTGESETVSGIDIVVTPGHGNTPAQSRSPAAGPPAANAGTPTPPSPNVTPTFPPLPPPHSAGQSGASAQGTSAQAPSSTPMYAPHRSEGNSRPQIPAPLSPGMLPVNSAEGAEDLPIILTYVSAEELVVGEPFIVDYVYLAPMWGSGFNAVDLSEPAFRNAWFRDVSQWRGNQRRRLGQQRINAQPWDAQLLRSYTVVPLREGEFEIPSMSVNVEARSLAANRAYEIESDSGTIRVRPIPEEGKPAGAPNNLGRFVIESGLDEQEARVGDTVEARYTLRGFGIPAMMSLPALPAIDGAQLLDPEDTEVTEIDPESGLPIFAITRRFRMQAQQEGVLTIPAYEVNYYDPWTASWQSVRADEQTVLIEGVNTEAIDLQSQEQKDEGEDWMGQLPPPEPARSSIAWTASLRQRGEPWLGSPLVWALLCAPIVLVAGAGIGRRTLKKRRETSADRARENAGRDALRGLRKLSYSGPASFTALSQTLRRFVSIRTGEQAMGATHAEFEALANRNWAREKAEPLCELLETLEEKRFAGASEADFQELRQRLIRWIEGEAEAS